MKTFHHTPLSAARRPAPGFSLVEMIIVVAIAAAILALAAPYTMGALQAANLASAGDTLMQKLALAQQRALSQNRPVALDFYYYTEDGIQGCHAIQLQTYDPATTLATPMEPPVYWHDQQAVLLEGALSPMFTTVQTVGSTGRATQPPFQALEATYYRIIFYPNGTTNLRVPLRTAYLTLISTKNYRKDMETPPSNYYTVQVDPVTGRGHSYRP